MNTNDLATRILIIDDDEDDFFIIKNYIENINGHNFIIDWCYDYEEALTHICHGRYDLYFVDYRLGKKTGVELLKDALKNNCEEPIIVLTGKGNRQVDLDAMQAGAFDYQIKPDLNSEKLERSIRYALDKAAGTKALKINERKFRGIFEKSKDAVFLANEKLFFMDANFATSELFGYSKDELLETSLYDLLGNKDEQLLLEQLIEKKGEVDDHETELITKKGEQKSCLISLSKEIDVKGEYYIQGIIHDITNMKKAERATLQSEKLRAAGRLVQTLAHEIRNPLNNINLSVEQLRYVAIEDESQLFMDIIHRNTKSINDMISELLNSSRQTETIFEKNDLKIIMDAALEDAMDRIKLKKIEWKVEYPAEPVFIMADKTKLKIAFLNIIINAIEAMEEKKGKLKISIKEDEANYLVYIQDNGSGISDENLTRLFEPYFTSKRNGLGLGLVSTFNILNSNKAMVEVKTKLNQGTTFILRFKKP